MIEFIIIAFLQGLLEWLPISSSGQTIIFSVNLLGIPADQAFSLSIWLHLGTTLAVLVKFRKEYFIIGKSFLPKKFDIDDIDMKKRNWLIFGTIGTAITALPLFFIFRYLISGGFIAIQGDILTLIIAGLLIITGIILIYSKRKYGMKKLENISLRSLNRDSFISGLAQGASILPGISRSGITTSTILLENYKQNESLKLSFLMSVPVALASIGVDIIFGEGNILNLLSPLLIIVVTVISFIVGYLTMEILLRVASRIKFGYFCLLYGIIAYIIIIPFLII
jgi:undecaprenyl-diphosphatase